MTNTIICGDSFSELCELKEESVDLIITSPPYFQQREYTSQRKKEIGNEDSIEQYIDNLCSIFSQCVRVCKSTGNIVFNLGDKYIKGGLQLIPYQFALKVIKSNKVKLINDITWVKTNPTPRQYDRRLISATEPFFHFVKNENYHYNRKEFLDYSEPVKPKKYTNKGQKYEKLIKSSELDIKEKFNALLSLRRTVSELKEGKITDFRMKIRGIHKKAFGGQSGGRNNEIEKQGYTIIRMYGNRIKRDVIESPVPNSTKINHPAIFSLTVVKELVKLLSKEQDLVLDPFCGSGQVGIVAKELNRNFVGIDLNKEYCELARSRLL